MALTRVGCIAFFAVFLLGTQAAAARQRVEMPLERDVPIALLAPELPAESLAEGEQLAVAIEFLVNLRGAVVKSRLLSSTHETLGQALLSQHGQWVYAVATTNDECTAMQFRGVQQIVIERKAGKLAIQAEPAEVTELLKRTAFTKVESSTMVPNYAKVLGRA